MNTIYGYCRISRKAQSIDRQIRNIKSAYPQAVILQEAYTGTKVEGRKEFEKLCKAVKSGDTIVFDSVSRMSRNAQDGFSLYKEFLSGNIELIFLKEPHINTAVYKEAAEKQISTISTGDDATDELMKAITDGINRYMLRLAEKQIILAFEQSEKEVTDLHQRTKEGLQTAKLNGKTLGRAVGSKVTTKKESSARTAILKYSRDFNGSLRDEDVIKLIGISRNTYYRYKARLRNQ